MITIIPAIDIIDGKCVRLQQGDFTRKKIYNEDPLAVARSFEDAGIKRLHIVDLDGAKQGRVVNHAILEKIASQTKLQIDFGGGIRTEDDILGLFNSGASFISVGSIAYKDPVIFRSWISRFGAGRILLGADVKNEHICISGWLEETTTSVYDFIRENIENGITDIFCTDIAFDGMMEGPAYALYKKILSRFDAIHLIASGGVSCMEDIIKLEQTGCTGVIVGKAIYESGITMKQISDFITQQNTSIC